MFNISQKTLILNTVLALTPLAMAGAPQYMDTVQVSDGSLVVPSNKYQEEVSRLLRQIGDAAHQTAMHADRLQSFVRTPHSYRWETHASELAYAKDLVNSKGKVLERLRELRSEALPWQQQAINRIQPALLSLAEETTKAIRHVNGNRRWLHTSAYQETLSNIYNHADTVRDYLAAKLDYVQAKTNLDKVEAGAVTG